MTAEYLLDAVGFLDDDLILEAEQPVSAPVKAVPSWFRRYGGPLAACLAVAVTLSWCFSHIGDGLSSNSSGGSGGTTAGASTSATGGTANGGYPGDMSNSEAAEPPAPPSGEGAGIPTYGNQSPVYGGVYVEYGYYSLTGEILAELPESVELELVGKLSALYPDAPAPSTDAEEYVGLRLWAENDGTGLPPAVYVELPEGGYAVAELTQP